MNIQGRRVGGAIGVVVPEDSDQGGQRIRDQNINNI